VNIYLVLTGPSGPILGESVSEHHPDAIDVQSYSVGGTMPVDVTAGSGGSIATGRLAFSEMTIAKQLDRSSPSLLSMLAQGRNLSADIYVENLEGTLLTWIHLNNAFLTGQQSAGGPQRPVESLSLAFGSMFWTYYVLNPDGSVGSTVTGGWDTIRNRSCSEPVFC
jgi:type VI secretion system secreted protein Hcp